MTVSSRSGAAFPKSYRLLRSQEFRFAHPKKIRFDGFQFVYSTEGKGRLGISISKKVLRRANARNRVRRLLKEGFRLSRSGLRTTDIHVVGVARLGEIWRELTLEVVLGHFMKLSEKV